MVLDVEAHGTDVALVLADPHVNSLAWGTLKHLVGRGHGRRILFDRLNNLDRVLAWRWLRPSRAKNPLQRQAENEESARAFADVLCRRRGLSLERFPLMEEWVISCAVFYLEQDDHTGLDEGDLPFTFIPGHKTFDRMLGHCQEPLAAAKFQQLADGKIPRSQYAPAARLITSVCHSPAFRARCGASFDLPTFLDNSGILILEGGAGATLSDDAMRTMLGTVVTQLIHYIRSRPRPFPRVRLALDEALNANLVTQREAKATAELQKAGLDIDILVQNPNFPSSFSDDIFTNCRRHEWYFCGHADVARLGAIDLGNPDYQHELMTLKVGERFVKQNHRVWKEYVELLEEPWGYPELTQLKALRALEQIRCRPEYKDALTIATRTHSQPTPPAPPPEPDNPNLGI